MSKFTHVWENPFKPIHRKHYPNILDTQLRMAFVQRLVWSILKHTGNPICYVGLRWNTWEKLYQTYITPLYIKLRLLYGANMPRERGSGIKKIGSMTL
jgi:hypothetical protein